MVYPTLNKIDKSQVNINLYYAHISLMHTYVKSLQNVVNYAPG